MSSLLRMRLVYDKPRLADRIAAIASQLDLFLERYESHEPNALVGPIRTNILMLDQIGAPLDNICALVYSLNGALPEVLITVIVSHPRSELERGILEAGAFDVLDDGPTMESDLAHSLAPARRVVALQEERAQLTSELAHQDKLSALGVLAAGVSHEINNPCAAILSNMNVVRDQLESVLGRPRFQRLDSLDVTAGDWIEAIGDCINAANRIHSIVKTLNVFSRKNDSAPPTPIDINDEIRTVMRLIGKEVRFQAEIEVSLNPNLPRIMAPPNIITQIVTNLVVNALQALEGSGVLQPRVSLSTEYDDDHVMLEVHDNGPGIADEVLSRIFDPFFTTKPIGKGTGLGLSITQQLVHKVGGEIFAESDPGHGARFSVVLERTMVDVLPLGHEHRMPPASDRLRVLLLDDDELILRSMQRSLSPHFECQAAARAATALELLRADGDFDAVVSDVVMPEMNGLEFWNELEHVHPDLALRTVFISGGITSDKLRVRVSDTGRPCLAKPVDMHELIRTIRRLGRPFEEIQR